MGMDKKPVEHENYSQPSVFGKMVKEQNRMQPKYCNPGEATGEMHGEKVNKQKGA